VMLLVSVVMSHLTRRVRDQAAASRERERRTAALYDMSRDLGRALEKDALVAAAARHIGRIFDSQVLVFVPEGGDLGVVHRTTGAPTVTSEEMGVARWVFANNREAGLSTATLPGAAGLFLPLATSEGLLGVLGLIPHDRRRFDDPEERRFLDAFAAQMGVAVERTQVAEETERTRLEAERERLRSTLLSSVSHDLRTPLGVIEGASSTLLDHEVALDEPTQRDLLETIHEAAGRLNRRVRNLLDMTRLEAGAVELNREWQSPEEVVGVALGHLQGRLEGREVKVAVSADLPLFSCDAVLVEQVLVNLLENALKYSPPGAAIEVSAREEEHEIVISVADRGPGIPPGEEARIFEKFYRAARDRAVGGVGLGLAICRAIVAAHGGRIWAENRVGGGAAFHFALPRGDAPATMAAEEATG
jgi:two-component system sensor histidine kinase KdpD